ncbi:MAG: lysophospholipid acyltransferase family protein [Edaphobacter sp.]|uniref:lysophospholipid acyltransferase family protein n=1 Tax=Edaphobacter sp. TaxID=1934404 RepID=UPI002395C386|nr:lysophospholipid acyltransferase family protein [Edaphobacter sp.]MDE1176466.1 lysophospholipid acyltransferase family protein [Edaphobacter sp.]
MAEPEVQYTFKQRLILAIVPPLAYMVICLLGVTLRFEDICEPGMVPQYHTPPPLIYAIWHRCLLACAWRFRQGNLHILISRSFDGELIARTVERLGFVAVRGSSSRDGAVGMRNLHRAYLEKNYIAITADGPRGPAQKAKPGVAQLAGLVGAPVGAVYLHPSSFWVLRSWDRFMIPKPFSKVTVSWTVPVVADQKAVQDALDRATKSAESSPHGK